MAVSRKPGEAGWRAVDVATYSTDALAAYCATLLERWTNGGDA
jgi:hypothetical protein